MSNNFTLAQIIDRVKEMAVLSIMHDAVCMKKIINRPKKVEVIFVPVFFHGVPRWVCDVVADNELQGFTEIAFVNDGTKDSLPKDQKEAALWLKEYFDMTFDESWVTCTADNREPMPQGYTIDDVVRMTQPVGA